MDERDDHKAATDQAPRCPECGERGIPIAYGFPLPELFEEGARGEVILGGCVTGLDDDTHGCPNGHSWRV